MTWFTIYRTGYATTPVYTVFRTCRHLPALAWFLVLLDYAFVMLPAAASQRTACLRRLLDFFAACLLPFLYRFFIPFCVPFLFLFFLRRFFSALFLA